MPFYSPKNSIHQNFKKWKHLLKISFYTCVPKIILIWCMVPEIQSETDKIFGHFGWFFALLPPLPPNDPENQNFERNKWKKMPGDIILLFIHMYHKWRSYDIWLLKYKVQQTNFCHFGPFFALSAPWQPGKSKF